MSPIRSFICPESFHKIAEACGRSAAYVRDPTCDLLGRHPDHASGSTGDCQDFQYGSSTIGELGIPYQTGEVLPLSNSSTSILKSPPRFQEDDIAVRVPMEKVQNLQVESAKALRTRSCSMHQLAAMIGRMNQTSRIGIHQALLRYRALQWAYIRCLHQWGHHTRSQPAQVPLDSQALEELK